jgi:hypothetical protein
VVRRVFDIDDGLVLRVHIIRVGLLAQADSGLMSLGFLPNEITGV